MNNTDYEKYLINISNHKIKENLLNIIDYIEKHFPQLVLEIKWNQPMLTYHNTYIIGFSCAKDHISIAPEKYVLDLFTPEIEQYGYEVKKQLFSIKQNQEISFELLAKIINYKINDKVNCTTFWK